jgi:hypothetical protein
MTSIRAKFMGPVGQLGPFPFSADVDDRRGQSRSDAGNRALQAVESISRRIDDLARELNCLGFFDDEDGPRAA